MVSERLTAPLSLLEYGAKHWSVKTPGGRAPMRFDRHPYLLGLYECEALEIIVKKSAQCCVSEWLACRAFFLAEIRAATGLYCFPKDKQLNDFSHARIDPAILFSPHLRSIVTGINNVGLKDVAGSFLYFRGMQTLDQINSVDADFLFLDEYDRMNQTFIPQAKKRLGASEYKHFIGVSVPSFPGYGIDKAFAASDGREWFIPCGSCKHRQVLTMDLNVEPATKTEPARFVCAKCRKPIDHTKAGEWVAARPEIDVAGFHISKLMSPTSTAAELLKSKDEGLKAHMTSDLGVAYDDGGGQVDDDVLNACRGDIPRTKVVKSGFMGVDVGRELHVVLGPAGQVSTALTVKDFEDLDPLMKSGDVGVCIVDALPETREARRFAARFPGRVWIAYYTKTPPDQAVYTPKDKRGEVHMNRTETLDDAFDSLLDRETVLPADYDEIEGFRAQVKAPQRVKEKNRTTGNMVVRYDEMGQADHYAHAFNYWKAAPKVKAAKRSRVLTRGIVA